MMRRLLPLLLLPLPAIAAENAILITPPERSLVSPGVARAEAEIREIPGGVALVPSEEFSQTRAVTVKDMLDFTPGVLAQSRVAEESRLSIRGSGLSRTFHLRGLTLLQDGIPINLADGAGDFQDIDPLALRYVEVYKGANALRYGGATLGGAINFVTPTGYDASPFTARVEGGSFNTRRAHVSSGQAIGKTDYYASFSSLFTDGYRDFSEQQSNRFSTTIGQKLNENLETRLYLTYGDVNLQLPGNLTKAQLAADPRQANAANLRNNYQRDYESLRLASKTTWRGDGVTLSGGAYTTQKDLYHPIFQLVDQQNNDVGVFADATFEGSLAGKRNELTLGARASHGNTDSKRYVNLAGGYGAPTASSDETARNANLYVENRFHATDRLALIAGSQFLLAERDFEDRFLSDGDRSAEKSFYGASPKIGALWEAAPGIQLYGNLSRSYEPPTFSELTQMLPGVTGLADIDTQKATTLEIGSRGLWRGVEWDASLYRSWLKDELMMYSLAPGQTGVTNADDTIHQGLELGLGARIGEHVLTRDDALKMRLAYTYSDFRFDNDRQYGDNRIPGAPEHYLRAELRYDHPAGFFLAPNVEAVPQGYDVDMKNTLQSSGYALLGLRAGYRVTKEVNVFLDARNLLDKTYAATTDVITEPTATNTAVFAPGEGRAVYVGLSYAW